MWFEYDYSKECIKLVYYNFTDFPLIYGALSIADIKYLLGSCLIKLLSSRELWFLLSASLAINNRLQVNQLL